MEKIPASEREGVNKLKIGIDGLNISESSSSYLRPILGSIQNAKRSDIFVIGK